ncbi:MAG: TFIIB-type zinc finger domain-containing protein [Olsenella sp.]|nr:TFIIB-type zinc finger domain-containing protein [Olsenella sp.]
MKRLVCEMCGSNEIRKENGVFVCQSCGCQYTLEEARKMMVEGVVEVTGSVAIDNSSNVTTWIDLARKAVAAQNGAQANDYADKILQADSGNAEAWFIKGRAALLQSTVGIDRQSEALKYFTESARIVHGRLDSASADDIKLIRDIQKASTEMALTRALVFANSYSDFQSQDGLQRLLSMKSICGNVASSNTAAASPLKRCKDKVLEVLTESGMSRAAAERTFREILDYESESGEMFAGVALTLNNVANTIGRSSIKSWEANGHIFDFYGLENSTREMGQRRENKAWSEYIDGLDDAMKIIQVAVDLYERPETAKFMNSESKLDSAIRGCYDNLIYLQCHARDARTNRRYHNQLSNGNIVTKDGIFLADSAKAQRNSDITKWTTARDAHDPVKRLAKQRKLEEEQAQRRRERAERHLMGQYYSQFPEEKDAFDAASAVIERSSKERAECVESIKGLGLFQRKEQKRLEARIAELKTAENRAKKEIESIEARRTEWVRNQLPALLAKDESDWKSTGSSAEVNHPSSAVNSTPASPSSGGNIPFNPTIGSTDACFALRRVIWFDKNGQELQRKEFSYENGVVTICTDVFNHDSVDYKPETMHDNVVTVQTDGEGKPMPSQPDFVKYTFKYGDSIEGFITEFGSTVKQSHAFGADGFCKACVVDVDGQKTMTLFTYGCAPDGRVLSYIANSGKTAYDRTKERHDVKYDDDNCSLTVMTDGVPDFRLDYEEVQSPSKWLLLRSKIVVFDPPALMYA